MAGELSTTAATGRILDDALQIESVSLLNLTARYLTPGGPSPYAINLDLGPVHRIQRKESIHGVFPIRVAIATIDSEGHTEEMAEIELSYQCLYKKLCEFGEAESRAIPAFLATAGWSHAWPYLRSELQDISTKMGLPPLVLPMLLPGQAEGIPVILPDESVQPSETSTSSSEE